MLKKSIDFSRYFDLSLNETLQISYYIEFDRNDYYIFQIYSQKVVKHVVLLKFYESENRHENDKQTEALED